jgi:hypothetical protein
MGRSKSVREEEWMVVVRSNRRESESRKPSSKWRVSRNRVEDEGEEREQECRES